VHVFENLRIDTVPNAVREQQQPLERTWPFEGEGHMVQQENGPQDLIKNNDENKQ
jgi:hypothetical protein